MRGRKKIKMRKEEMIREGLKGGGGEEMGRVEEEGKKGKTVRNRSIKKGN